MALFELSSEAFDMLTTMDPLPLLLIDFRAETGDNSVSLPASVTCIKPGESTATKLPEDGCICVVYDDERPDQAFGDQAVVYYNTKSTQRSNTIEPLQSISFETLSADGM